MRTAVGDELDEIVAVPREKRTLRLRGVCEHGLVGGRDAEHVNAPLDVVSRRRQFGCEQMRATAFIQQQAQTGSPKRLPRDGVLRRAPTR